MEEENKQEKPKEMTIEEARQAEEEFSTILRLFREAGGIEKK